MKIIKPKIFTALLVFYPMLYLYESPAGPLSLADTLLIIIFPFCLLELFAKKFISINKIQLSLFLFTAGNLFLILFFSASDPIAVIRNEGHFLLVLLTLALMVPNLFDRKLGIDLLCKASVISSLYLIMQVFMIHVFHIYIKGQVSFLVSNVSAHGDIRPFSFFSEPAGFGTYNAVGLAAVLLWKPYRQKTNRLMAMIITLALLVSLSSTSIGLLFIVWGWYVLPLLFQRKSGFWINSATIFIVFSVCIVFLMADYKMNIVETIYNHIAPDANGKMAAGLYNRMGNIFHMGDAYEFGWFEVIFGHGLIELKSFLPAVARTYLYFGITGYAAVILYFITLFRSSGSFGKLIIIMVFANSLFGDPVFGLALFGTMEYVMCDIRMPNGIQMNG